MTQVLTPFFWSLKKNLLFFQLIRDRKALILLIPYLLLQTIYSLNLRYNIKTINVLNQLTSLLQLFLLKLSLSKYKTHLSIGVEK